MANHYGWIPALPNCGVCAYFSTIDFDEEPLVYSWKCVSGNYGSAEARLHTHIFLFYTDK